MTDALFTSHLRSLPRWQHGKVRDMYEIDDQHLLILTTDRLLVLDVILPTAIPGKGEVLTSLSNFWMNRLSHVVPNHLTDLTPTEVLLEASDRNQARGRSNVVKRVKPLPIAATVCGYMVGPDWQEYCKKGDIFGQPLPKGLQQAEQLPVPMFIPSTKAALGGHGKDIDFDTARNLIGTELATQVHDVALRLYREAASYARNCGIIIAETRFKFGLDADGQLLLIGEALTPDSSRFWPADAYQVGHNPPSFDKQCILDFLLEIPWHPANPPDLPRHVVRKTAEKYQEARVRITACR